MQVILVLLSNMVQSSTLPRSPRVSARSPPSSPSLLAKINENEDDFAVSSDSDAWSLNSDRSSQLYRSGSSVRGSLSSSGTSLYNGRQQKFGSVGKAMEDPVNDETEKEDTAEKSSRTSQSSSPTTPRPRRRESDDSVELLPVSSDSYFSLHREMLEGGDEISESTLSSGSPSVQKLHKRSRRRSGHRSMPRSRSRTREEVEISPSAQIFKNMLILEESLRQQNAQQSRIKTKYTVFLLCMVAVLLVTTYVWWFGEQAEHSGSKIEYWRIFCQVVCSIDLLTLVLYYISGEYNRTVAQPRRFLTYTNKGIRRLNIRLVKVHVRTVDRFLDSIKVCLTFPTIMIKWQCRQLLRLAPRWQPLIKLNNWLVEFQAKLQTSSARGGVEGVKIVLNPRVFSTSTREQWELYRNEFWNKETIRRRRLLQLKQQ